ncbi:MAG: RIP metalloprotease RseP [Deltaproteobacteria bacterium]|jgi:regulator of sigma E protease|nr:RIP metalloprotease RseP [Deltaproteobacteria bacterium]
MLITIVSFIVLLLVLIFVHELGHFLAAKLLGVRVEKFSLGFPPKAWSKKIGETEYQLAWLPLGGYVALFGETPGTEISPEDQPYSFSHKPLWVRAVVVFAGPFFNIIFAVLALWLVNFSAGVQYLPAVVGPVELNGPAYEAGILIDDVVTKVNGQPVSYFSQIGEAVMESGGKPVVLTVTRGPETLDLTVTPVKKEFVNLLGDDASSWSVGFDERTRPVIGRLQSGKSAEKVGIKEGDLIVSINGTPTPDWVDVVTLIRQPDQSQTKEVDGETIHPEPQPIDFAVSRDGQTLNFKVTPTLEATHRADGQMAFVPILGISPKLELLREPLGIGAAFIQGLRETWVVTKLTGQTFARLIQRKLSVKVLGGPLMIAEVSGQKAREGLIDFIWVMALISVNLAILNLVPIPILDGGQLLFYLIEALKRKPLSLKFREACQWVGITAMVGLMVLVFYNDIHRLVTRISGPAVTQVEGPR